MHLHIHCSVVHKDKTRLRSPAFALQMGLQNCSDPEPPENLILLAQ